MQSSSSKNPPTTPGSAKRRSGQLDFSNLGPLKTGGTVGFSTFRDQQSEASRKNKARKKSNGALADDSDEDDEDDKGVLDKMNDSDDKYDEKKLGAEDAKSSGELADGVNRIHVSTEELSGGWSMADTRDSLREPIRLNQTTTRRQKHPSVRPGETTPSLRNLRRTPLAPRASPASEQACPTRL
jgi:hypothetical protein